MTARRVIGSLAIPVWICLLVPVVLLCILPVSNAAQAMLGASAVLLVVALKPFVSHMAARLALMGTASVVVLRY
ncbi:hypothetical protein ACFOHK_17110 [Falsigemmobacter intermedius]|uniref:hypothetical protein n=1 Tax=Falsigemmobacter intermedius TaxID=1553448 RepID=UPI001F501394|nr:hypothetical protein [Falsigemmobacter intermedius]